MRFESRRVFLAATAIAVVCLAGVAMARSQAAPAQGGETVQTTDTAFKNVMMLKGIPVDNFFESMGMFASAMGADCTFCHVSNAYFDKGAFATPTPRIQVARGMIAMMNAINKQYFKGQTRVTCFTCHAGSQAPRSEPDLAQQYGAPMEDPNARLFPIDTRPGVTAQGIFDKYLKAVGSPGALAKFTSFAAKGTYEGFDTAFDKVPVEIFGKAPAQQSMVVHMFNGASTRTFNGAAGWMAGPDTPVPLLTLTGGNLDGARIDASVWFPASIPQLFKEWRVGRTAIDDKEVTVVQGVEGGVPRANFYFDDAGLLIRQVRWTQTPVGFVPTQVDYSDYRDVAGIKMAHHRTVSQTYMQMTLALASIQPTNVEAARFNRPAPAAEPRIQK